MRTLLLPRLMLVTLGVLGSCAIVPMARGADAQPPAGERKVGMAGLGLEVARRALDDAGLSDDQKKKVDEIFADAKQKLQVMVEEFRDKQTPPDERKEKMRAFMADFRGKIAPLLDDTQKQKVQEKMAALREGGGAAGLFAARLKEAGAKLDLSGDQKTKFDALVVDVQKKFEALKPGADGDRAGLVEKAKQAREDTIEQLKAILSPDQLARLKELLQAPKAGGAATPGV